MKVITVLGLAVACMLATGCVSTVADDKTGGVPLVKDKKASRYERPVAQVHEAAKAALLQLGALSRDTSLLSNTNTTYVLEGRVNQRTVWVRVEAVEPRLTEVTVQARTKGGGTDLDLVAEVDKHIALKLMQ